MLEMNRLHVNILGVCEIRWPNNRDFICDKHKIMYAGEEKKEWRADEILEMMKWRQKQCQHTEQNIEHCIKK